MRQHEAEVEAGGVSVTMRYRDDVGGDSGLCIEVYAEVEGRQTELEATCSADVEAGVARLFAAEPEPPSVMFDHVYAEPPAELARQRDEGLRAIAAEREAKHRG